MYILFIQKQKLSLSLVWLISEWYSLDLPSFSDVLEQPGRLWSIRNLELVYQSVKNSQQNPLGSRHCARRAAAVIPELGWISFIFTDMWSPQESSQTVNSTLVLWLDSWGKQMWATLDSEENKKTIVNLAQILPQRVPGVCLSTHSHKAASTYCHLSSINQGGLNPGSSAKIQTNVVLRIPMCPVL